MAAKGGGSNQGLIITLIFFVLATIILGVTTYLGFDGQTQFLKEKTEALKKQKDWEAAANWYRAQALIERAYLGRSFPKDQEPLAQLRRDFDEGKLKGDLDPAKEDATKLVKEILDQELGWDRDQVKAKTTYRQQIEALIKERDDAKKNWNAIKEELAAEKNNVAAAKKERDDTRGEYEKKFQDMNAKFAAVQKKAGDDAAKYAADLDALSKDLAQVKTDMALLQENTTKGTQVAQKKIRELERNLSKYQEQAGQSSQGVVNPLDFDRPKGKVTTVSPTGDVFIDLGSADGVKPQLTFSVYTLGSNGKPIQFEAVGIDGKPLFDTNGKMIKEGKATMEVVRTVGAHQSLARLTSVRDAGHDPVIRGDVIFNPAWDPNKRPRVAVAGLADLTGDGTDNTAEFLRWLDKQGMDIDAWMDPRDLQIKGRGISRDTDYVIIGDAPEGGRKGDRAKDIVERMHEMEATAREKAVALISLRKFLVLTGFRMPKISAGSGGSFEEYRLQADLKEKEGRKADKPKDEKKPEKKEGKDDKEMKKDDDK
jgi:hypothetical protein